MFVGSKQQLFRGSVRLSWRPMYVIVCRLWRNRQLSGPEWWDEHLW